MRVVIYGRNIKNEIMKEMKEYIETQENWEIKKIYTDIGSGLDKNRVDYNNLITGVKNKEMDILFVNNISSLSRNIKELLELTNLLEENNIKLFVYENKDFYKIKEQLDV